MGISQHIWENMCYQKDLLQNKVEVWVMNFVQGYLSRSNIWRVFKKMLQLYFCSILPSLSLIQDQQKEIFIPYNFKNKTHGGKNTPPPPK